MHATRRSRPIYFSPLQKLNVQLYERSHVKVPENSGTFFVPQLRALMGERSWAECSPLFSGVVDLGISQFEP